MKMPYRLPSHNGISKFYIGQPILGFLFIPIYDVVVEWKCVQNLKSHKHTS